MFGKHLDSSETAQSMGIQTRGRQGSLAMHRWLVYRKDDVLITKGLTRMNFSREAEECVVFHHISLCCGLGPALQPCSVVSITKPFWHHGGNLSVRPGKISIENSIHRVPQGLWDALGLGQYRVKA